MPLENFCCTFGRQLTVNKNTFFIDDTTLVRFGRPGTHTTSFRVNLHQLLASAFDDLNPCPQCDAPIQSCMCCHFRALRVRRLFAQNLRFTIWSVYNLPTSITNFNRLLATSLGFPLLM